jgi:hypothetical protein
MSAPSSPGRAGLARRLAAPVLLLLLLGWTAIVHHGLGPRPDLGAQWYSPTGFLARAVLASPLESLVAVQWKGLLAFWTPALLLALGCWLTTRSALLRTAALALALASGIFLLYALGSEMGRVAWTLFHWRASATMLAISFVIAAALAAPWLAASWLRLPRPLQVATFLPVAFGVIAIERGVTGTNPRLPFAISPWPAVQVFGLEVVGTIVASLLAGAALGLAGLAAWRRGRGAAGLAGAAAGLALPAGWLLLGSQGFLPFRAGARGLVVATVLCALALAMGALPRPEPGRLARRARTLGTAAVLLGLPLLIGQAWARLDYARNRDVYAQRVIDALAAFYAREQIYPETLQALVTHGDLDAIPAPQVGFGFLGDGAGFTYQAFGTSYLLEFPAPRWVQCAYNPPYDDEEPEEAFVEEERAAEDDEEAEDEDLGGSWSCPSSPPELW